MGYYTDFAGEFIIEPKLTPEHLAYLQAFTGTRRMKRDKTMVAFLGNDPVRTAAGLPIGEQGGFYVAGTGHAGQGHDVSVIDSNRPPESQPSLWCSFEFDNEGLHMTAQDGKNYDYVTWVEYMLQKFFIPWGYKLDGSITWRGEDSEDLGMMEIIDNKFNTYQGSIVYE
jgi:hypothetical protein